MRKKELRGSSGQVNGRLFSYCEGRGFSRARPRCVDIEQEIELQFSNNNLFTLFRYPGRMLPYHETQYHGTT